MTIRTRFAPSPTGFLHVGSARTALYSWLFARKMGGKFILRIEDTDLERSTQAAVDAILEAMEWLGLNWDEGPFYQTKHFDRYREVANLLIESGHAYRCYCSKERLEKLREAQFSKKEKTRYDGHCRDLNEHHHSAPFVIRFRNPVNGDVVIDDAVKGQVTVSNEELDDLIMVRSDGTPTYNFTVVVDDWDMKITHVIRGDDHLNNTPRQINILKALGAKLPIYAHIPMILGSDGKRLSKRHGAVSVQQYRTEGFLPEALLNYLVRLGWSHGDKEIFSRDEMIQFFDLSHINKAPAAFNTEKLLWLNQHYLKTGDPAVLAVELEQHLQSMGIKIENGPPLVEVVKALQERAKTLQEMAEKSVIFYQDVPEIDPILKQEHLTPEVLPALQKLRDAFEAMTLDDWKKEKIHVVLTTVAEVFGLKLGKLAQPLRVALTGTTTSPPIDITLQLIAKKTVLMRLDRALRGG